MKRVFSYLFLGLLGLVLPGCGGGSMSTMDGGQNKDFVVVQGTLQAPTGVVLGNATVVVSGTSIQTQTSPDGTFSLEVERGLFGSSLTLEVAKASVGISNLVSVLDISERASSISLVARTTAEIDGAADVLQVDIRDDKGNELRTGPPASGDAPLESPTVSPTPSSSPPNGGAPTPVVTPSPPSDVPPVGEPIDVVPTPILPSAPRVLAAAIPMHSAIIIWETQSSADAGYVIYRSVNGGVFQLAGSAAAGTDTFIDSYMLSGTDLANYKVSAVSAAGEGPTSANILASPDADLNGDLCVDSADQAILGDALNATSPEGYNAKADFDKSGKVTLGDAVTFSSWFGWCAH